MIKRSTQSTACEGSERCSEKEGPHRYCRLAVHSRSVPRHRRSRRHGAGLSLLLAAVALTGSGCALGGHPGAPPPPHVLGEPKATPLAVGQPAPAGTGELGAVSCANARRCWAVGVAGPNPAPVGTSAVVIVATANGGKSWKSQQVTGGTTPQLSGISCPTATECMAVGSNGASLPGSGVVVTTTDGGTTWSPTMSPQNALSVTSVACAGPTDCTVIVSDGTVTWSDHSADFGQSWQQEGGLPSPFLAGNDLTCAPGGPCLVAGYVPTSNGHGQGAIALTTDGGQTWALATVPPGIGLLQSVACLSVTECLAAGTTNTTVSDVVPAKGELLRQRGRGAHLADVDEPTARRRRLRYRLPVRPAVRHCGNQMVWLPGHRHRSSRPERRRRGNLPRFPHGLCAHHPDGTVLSDRHGMRGGGRGHRGPTHPPQAQTSTVTLARLTMPCRSSA